MSLTIEDIQVEKLELKNQIERLLKMFENKTQCTITKITGRRIEYFINHNDNPEIKSYMGINLTIEL